MSHSNSHIIANLYEKTDIEIQEAIIKTFNDCNCHEFTISDVYQFGFGMSRYSKRTVYGRNEAIPYQRIQAQLKKLGGYIGSARGRYLLPAGNSIQMSSKFSEVSP